MFSKNQKLFHQGILNTIMVFGFLLISQFGFSQLDLKKKTHDFELLRRADQNWVDFRIENNSNKTAQLFRLEVPKNVQVLFSSKTISPDSSAIIRVSFSPKKVGDFKEVLKLYASHWSNPKEITLKGESTYVADSNIPCPSFDTPHLPTTSGFHVSVREQNGEHVLKDVTLVIYKSGERISEQKTNEHGETSFDIPNGRYFVSARTKTQVIDTALYVSIQNNHLILSFPQEEVTQEGSEPEILVDKTPEVVIVPEEKVAAEAEATLAEDVTPNTISEPIESRELPASLYSQNNLVFLVDVSTSMKKNGKLDLLKVAMVDLLEVLRPSDRFALISYASETNTIIQTDNNLDREACIASIKALQAGGSTEGARAIDVAGRTAAAHFVPDGNNQILLATDGAFNEATDKAKKIVAKYERRDINLSVIGIKCGPFTTKQMTELASLGGGRFIPLADSFDAGAQLLDEVKRSALK